MEDGESLIETLNNIGGRSPAKPFHCWLMLMQFLEAVIRAIKQTGCRGVWHRRNKEADVRMSEKQFGTLFPLG